MVGAAKRGGLTGAAIGRVERIDRDAFDGPSQTFDSRALERLLRHRAPDIPVRGRKPLARARICVSSERMAVCSPPARFGQGCSQTAGAPLERYLEVPVLDKLAVIDPWLFYPVTILLVLGGAWFGRRLGVRARRRDPDNADHLPAAQSVLIGLLYLMIGFTLNVSLGRWQARQTAVLHETNAIETALSRATLLPGEDAGQARALLIDYLHVRIALGAPAEAAVNAKPWPSNPSTCNASSGKRRARPQLTVSNRSRSRPSSPRSTSWARRIRSAWPPTIPKSRWRSS